VMRAAEHAARTGGLRTNAQWLLAGNVAFALGAWVQVVLLARAGGPSAVGSYAYALALTGPAVGFASLQLRALLATDGAGAYSFGEYRALRALGMAAAVVAVVALGWSSDGAPLLGVLVPVCLMRAAEGVSDVYHGVWQRSERMAVIGWALALNGVGSAVLMGVALAMGTGVAGGAAGAALGSAIALAFVHQRTAAARGALRLAPAGGLAWRRLLRLARAAAPLGGITLLTALQASVPRYFIQASGEEAALGLFAAAYQLPVAGGMVISALGSAAVPRLAALHEAGDGAAFRSLTRTLTWSGALLGVAGVALAIVLGRPLLAVLYDPSFAGADRMLVVLSAAAGLAFVASFQGYALTAARVIAPQPILLGGVTLVLGVACAALVPRFGGLGAAWAIVAASAVQVLASGALLRSVGRAGEGLT